MSIILPDQERKDLAIAFSKGYIEQDVLLSFNARINCECSKCHQKMYQGFKTSERFVYLSHAPICSQPVCTTYLISNGGCGIKRSK